MNHLKYEDKTSYLDALVILFFKTLYIKFVCTNKEIVSKNRFLKSIIMYSPKEGNHVFHPVGVYKLSLFRDTGKVRELE